MRTTRRYFGCCTSRCTSTTMVFSIFALVTLPISSVLFPRYVDGAVGCPAGVVPVGVASVVITPYLPSPSLLRRSTLGREVMSSLAPDLCELHEDASALPLARSSESAAEKSVLPDPFPERAILFRLLLESFQYAAPFLQPSCARNKFRRNRKLVRRQPHRLACCCFVHARHLEHDAPRLHYRHPLFRCAFALTHAGFGRLLGVRLVRENSDPQLAATLDEARNRHARSFNLAVGDPCIFHGLQTVFAKRQTSAAPRFAFTTAALLLSVLDLLRHQHRYILASLISNRWFVRYIKPRQCQRACYLPA